jgi:ligand-binding sensor domain-containing protein/signal transduction histidine kinase
MLYARPFFFKMVHTLKRKKYISLMLCFVLLPLQVVRAADSNSQLAETASDILVWRAADGLPSDSVTAIIQTRDGFLWVGTTTGLVRFDGVNFTRVDLTGSASNNVVAITALCEDEDGYLWIGTQSGGLFELEQGSVRHFTPAQGLLDEDVTSLAADNHGSIWIGTKSGLNLFAERNFQSFTAHDGLPDNFISGVHVARSGTVWITTRNGMCRFMNGRIVPYAFQTDSQGRRPEYLGVYEDRRGNLWAYGDTYLINLAEGKRFNYFRSSESASVRIWSLCEGNDGRLWIGTSGRGLFCFEDNSFQPVMLGENRGPYDVRAIYEDREGNLWLGTSGGGLLQLRPQSVHVLRTGQGLPDSLPTAFALDASGKIYVGLERGGLFVGESGRFDRVDGNGGLALQNFVTAVCAAPDGTVWAGTAGNGLFGLRSGSGVQYTTADGLADNTVLSVCVDAEGGVWASTRLGTLHRFLGQYERRFGRAEGLPGAPVTVMIPSASGGLWLGTGSGQILREEHGEFTRLATVDGGERAPVLALHEDAQSRLWIGTAGDGLTCLANGAVMNWNISNGLPDDIVAGVVEDKVRNLWLATGAGIYRVSHANLRRAMGSAKMPLVCELVSDVKTAPDDTTIFGGTRAVLSPDSGLWFATSGGVLNVDTHQPEIEPAAFPVYIESAIFNADRTNFLLSGGLWPPVATNNLPFNAPVDLRSLEIHFTALSFISPEEIHFRYRLDGFDSDWVNDMNSRLARYGRLPYGRYHFRVAARYADGPWLESPQTFAFIVPTPLYFQTWAICLYGFTAIALVTGIVRVVSHRRLRFTLARLEQQQSLERERMRIARDMHDEMGSKLTKISFLSEHAQVEAEATGPLAGKIESIAQTSRELLKTMDEIVWVVNPHNDTLENLVTYLSHYATEYFQNTDIECELRLPPEMPHYSLSSEMRHNLFLTFEEALNNVLKHSKAAKVRVEMAIKALEFEIKISDNGSGFAVPDLQSPDLRTRGGSGGNGLKNMRQRLANIGGFCLIASQPGGGATITLHFRLNPNTAGKL